MASASNRGACGTDDAPSQVSYDITPGGKIIPFSINLSGKSISFDPEPSNIWKVPKPKFQPKYIRLHGAELKALLQEPDINILRSYLTANYPLLESAHDVRNKLQQLVETYAPSDAPLQPDLDIPLLLTWLDDILQSYQRKFALFDVSLPSLEKSNLLEGAILNVKIEESRKKVDDLLKHYQDRLNNAEDNVLILSEMLDQNNRLVKDYEFRLSLMHDQMIALKRRPESQVGEKPEESQFFRELQKHLEQDCHLNSTFKEELALEKKTKHSLFQEICRLEELRILDEQQKQKEIAEILKDQEIEEGLRSEIIKKIKYLTPNADEMNEAVTSWMNTVRSCISENEDQIQMLRAKLKSVQDQLAQEKLQHELTNQQYNELIDMMLEKDAEINEKLEIFEAKQNEIDRLDQAIEALDSKPRPLRMSPTRYFDARSTLDSPVQSPESLSAQRVQSPDTGQSVAQSQLYSPELRDHSIPGGLFHSTPRSGIDSPEYLSSSCSHSFSYDESPEKLRQESPYRDVVNFDTGSPMYIHSTPRSAAASYSVSPPSPFNMPSPFIESFGERESAIPIPGTVVLPGPSRYATRIGAVDPSTGTRVSNRFEVGKSFILRTVCDTSTPFKQATRVASAIPDCGYSGSMIDHPLSVQHSAVLTPTQYKTPFISKSRFGYTDPTAKILNIPPDDHIHVPTPIGAATPSRQQGISPDVETYGSPPAVTPTSTRRYGLFTPTGIFRKKHYNIRTLFDPEYYESFELPWSPHEEHFGSPYAGNVMDRTFQASPIMDKTFYKVLHERDRTFDASPEPMDRTFVGTPQATNRTFIASSSPHALNRTFVESPVPINRTYNTSSPYISNGTFDASPCAMNQTYDASPLYAIDRTFSASSPIAMDRTYDAHSPLYLNRTYESPQNALNRTFYAPPSFMNQTFSNSPIHTNGSAINKSLSSPLGKTFQRSKSPTKTVTFSPDLTYNVSSPYFQSPSLHDSFHRNESSDLDRTTGKSCYDPRCCNIA